MEIPVTAIENSKAVHLHNKAKPRKDLEKAFEEIHESGNDMLLISAVFEDEKCGE
jgi:thiamine pyrophosphokinase